MVTVLLSPNMVVVSVGWGDPVLRLIVNDESANMFPVAMEYAALMVVQLVFVLSIQKESRVLG